MGQPALKPAPLAKIASAAAVCGVLALLAGPAPAQACERYAALDMGALRSDWREWLTASASAAATATPLVREQGTLGSLLAEGGSRGCGRGDWSLGVALDAGRRDYRGQSSSGRPLQTRSDLDQLALQARWLPWSTATGSLPLRWQAGLGLRLRRLERDIRSTGDVLGYPERFDTAQAALLLAASAPLGPGSAWQARAEAWFGGGPGGRVTLRLPGFDEARLRLGSSRIGVARLTLRREFADGWAARLALQASDERFRAGPEQALTRNGLLAGSAAQPATQQRALGLGLGLERRFGP